MNNGGIELNWSRYRGQVEVESLDYQPADSAPYASSHVRGRIAKSARPKLPIACFGATSTASFLPYTQPTNRDRKRCKFIGNLPALALLHLDLLTIEAPPQGIPDIDHAIGADTHLAVAGYGG